MFLDYSRFRRFGNSRKVEVPRRVSFSLAWLCSVTSGASATLEGALASGWNDWCYWNHWNGLMPELNYWIHIFFL